MREMDLIPEDYRRTQTARKLLIGFGIFYALIIAGLLVGKIILEGRVSSIQENIKIFEKQNQILTEQQQINKDLKEKKTAVGNQFAFVKMLQQGGGADQIFLVFDRVLGMDLLKGEKGNVWMDAWSYTAANLVSEDEKNKAQQMTIIINGRARDHEALSIFVERLIKQPEINDVQVKNTSMVGLDSSTVVFNMEIM